MAALVMNLLLQLVVAGFLKHSREEIYRFRAQPLSEVRTLVTLPAMSAGAAIIAGVGVNLATGDGGGNQWKDGIQLIIIGFVTVILIGVMLVVASRPLSPSRRLELRLSRISAALEDPFVPLRRAAQLKPEMRRYIEVGNRLIQRAERITFREWARQWMSDADMRIVVVACYVLPLTTLAAWLLNIYAGGWQNSFYGFVAFFLLAVVSAAAGPILQFRNYRAKCLNFGTVVRSYSASIIAAIDRLERLYGGEAGTDHNLQSGRGLGQSLRRTLRRLWQ